jgi:hypothetical protein
MISRPLKISSRRKEALNDSRNTCKFKPRHPGCHQSEFSCERFSGRQDAALHGSQGCLPLHFPTARTLARASRLDVLARRAARGATKVEKQTWDHFGNLFSSSDIALGDGERRSAPSLPGSWAGSIYSASNSFTFGSMA